ncbi:MAG: helical backbone metal receptor [Campylobacterota bacterium]|nr:helical backbone metal receptor [Campylobacterota bacterium]
MQLRYIFLLLFLSSNLFSYDRVVALSPSINEIIYALNSGEKIVGNTDFCNYPLEAKSKQKVGGFFSPNLERIVSLKPDLVIMQKSSENIAKKLNRLGIKTKVLTIKTLKDIKNSIETIGKLLDKKDEALKITATIDKKLHHIKDIVTNKKILMVIGHNLSLEKRIFVVGQNLYLDDIIKFSGNKNAFFSTRKGQPILNMENIIATDADMVILLSPYRVKKGLSKEQLLKPWRSLPISAVKDDNIFIIDGEYAGISSHRLIYFLDDMKKILQDVRAKELQ